MFIAALLQYIIIITAKIQKQPKWYVCVYIYTQTHKDKHGMISLICGI